VKRLLTVALVLFPLILLGAEKEKVELTSFAPGLVTAKGYVGRTMGEAFRNHNTDMTRYPGDLSVRLGYAAMVVIPNIDSILHNGLFPAVYEHGNRQLIAVADWKDSAFAGIFASGINTIDFGYIDSFFLTPDTTAGLDTARAKERDYIWISACIYVSQRRSYWYRQKLDTTLSKTAIVDSAVTRIVDSCSWCDSILNISNVDSTLAICEDAKDYGVRVWANARDWPYYPQANFWNPVDTHRAAIAMTSKGVRFPASGALDIAQYRNQTYLVNGVSRSYIVSSNHIGEIPLRAPGEISAIPLTTSGTLDGAYRYAVSWNQKVDTLADSIFNADVGYLSSVVKALSHPVLLSSFPVRPRDTLHAIYSMTDTTALCTLNVYRTAAMTGSVLLEDSLWLVDTLIGLNKHSVWDSRDYTDTTSDSTLRTKAFLATVGRSPFDSTPALRYIPDGADTGASTTNKVTFCTAPGAPAIIAVGNDLAGGAKRGLFNWGDSSSVDWYDCVGFAWVCTFNDTITGIYSDTGRGLVMYNSVMPDSSITKWSSVQTLWNDPNIGADSLNTGFSRDSTQYAKIVLPTSDQSSVVCDLYRIPLEFVKDDSAGTERKIWRGMPGPRGSTDWRVVGLDTIYTRHFASGISKVGVYYIGSFSPGDTIIDSLNFTDIQSQPELRRNSIPTAIKGVLVYGNRVVMYDEGGVYVGTPTDSGVFMSILDWHPINPNDGDQISLVFEQTQGIMKIAKNRSIYQMFQQNGTWLTPQLSSNYGCVAPLSYIKAPEGDYFLSLDGVRLEDENQYREKSFMPTLASSPIKSFTQQPASVLKTAIATYWDNKYILSIPGLDTSYVLGKVINVDGSISYVWHTWDLLISASAQFKSTDNSTGLSGDSLWFTMPGDSTIYIYGTKTTDNGEYIDWTWWSGPTNKVDGYMRYVEDAAYFINSNDTTSFSLQCRFTGDDLTAWGTETIYFNPLDSAKYHHFEQVGAKGGLFYTLMLTGSKLYLPGSDDEDWYTQIEAIWLTLSKREHYGSQ